MGVPMTGPKGRKVPNGRGPQLTGEVGDSAKRMGYEGLGGRHGPTLLDRSAMRVRF